MHVWYQSTTGSRSGQSRPRPVTISDPCQHPVVTTATFQILGELDLMRSLAPLAHGMGDLTIHLEAGRVRWTTRTRDGPCAIELQQAGSTLRAVAFGDGADRVLADIPRILGLMDEPLSIPDTHPLVTRLARRYPGIRIPRSGAVVASLVPAILEQKVIGAEAARAWRALVRVYGEAAPGPLGWGLRLGPSADTLAAVPYYDYHPFGVERRRADLIRAVASRAAWFEAIADMSFDDARARLMSVPGIGPWTAAEVAVRALGDPDAVSVGDFHLAHQVTFALVGEPRGTDERMLELLEPYRGQRARVMRLIELGGPRPPRRGPRLAIQRIDGR